jgi:hypothetical protein
MIPDALDALVFLAGSSRTAEPNLSAVHLLAWGRIGRVRKSLGARTLGAKTLDAKWPQASSA